MSPAWRAVAGALVLPALLGACASPASRESMAGLASAAKGHPYTVFVEVRGGAETGVLDSTNISNADFKAAIEASIAKSGLFRAVAPKPRADYELTVIIVSLSKPSIGFSPTVELETGWILAKAGNDAVAARQAFRSTHTATMGDALIGVTRGRLAVEGAARNNIAQGLGWIAALPL